MRRLLIFILFVLCSCSSQNRIINKKVIEVDLNSIGKTNINKELTSKITGINKNDLTTSLYYYSPDGSNEVVGLPINDRKFNYYYFNTNLYNNINKRKVKLFIEIYELDSKEVSVIYKIQ